MLRVLSQLIYIKKFDSVLKVRKKSFVSLKYPSDTSSPIYKSLPEENDHFCCQMLRFYFEFNTYAIRHAICL